MTFKTKPYPKPEKEVMTAEEFRQSKYKKALERKRKRPKKGKGSELSLLIKEADDWFSRRVRLEAADDTGKGRCVFLVEILMK